MPFPRVTCCRLATLSHINCLSGRIYRRIRIVLFLLKYFSFFVFRFCGRLSWLNCQLSSARSHHIITTSLAINFQSSTLDSNIFRDDKPDLYPNLRYKHNKCNIYILHTVNTTNKNKIEKLREKNKYVKRK